MPHGGYQQHRLNHKEPEKPVAGKGATILLDFAIGEGGRLKFTSQIQVSTNGGIARSSRAPHNVGNIAIKKGTKAAKVYFQLDGSKFWRFSNEYDAITTKEELSDYYGALNYDEDNAIRVDPTDANSEIIGYRKISFVVKENIGGRQGTSHSFSMNIDLLQTDPALEQDRSKWEWLPITIDPEIKNPPGGNENLIEEAEALNKAAPLI